MDTKKQYLSLLDLAEETARSAGDHLVMTQSQIKEITHESSHDIKINADYESEKIIIDALKIKTSFSILSEEIGFLSVNQENSLRWIIDPLDGTVNYFEGLPISCVSIGLWENDRPILGVIYDFIRRDLYKGIVGIGAYLNDIPIAVKQERSISKAILCTGFPVSMDFSEDSLSSFMKQVSSFEKVRLFGSAAMSLAFVASGKQMPIMKEKLSFGMLLRAWLLFKLLEELLVLKHRLKIIIL
ncbi:MAG: inositol monophosphatase [Deltaproteobacteria bacterium]|nr:MAG: inositol monophosphatase [Deltaproteobacteria bacterium]